MYTGWMEGGNAMRRTAYETARLKLAHVRLESGQALAAGLALLTQTVADALDVDRVGVWFHEDQGRQIACRELFVRSSRQHTSGLVIRASESPTYMRALKERRAIVADMARTHPSTCELADGYLAEHGIASLLDAPIIRGGQVIGVVCHERVGEPRAWTQREIDFAGSVGDLVALLLEQADRVELEAAMKIQAEQRLERLKLDALGLFARSVAHDLNNVLSVFAGAASEVEEAGLTETSESMIAAVEAGKRLSGQLFEVGGRTTNDTIGTDVGKLLGRLLPPLRALATRQVQLKLDVRASGLVVQVSEGGLERILFNLIANARDACVSVVGSESGRTGRVEIVARAAEPEDELPPDFVVVEVSDDGCGMDGRTREHLFEPYFTTKDTGHGLGLATVYGVVTRAGGSIEVASEVGHGASFRLALPREASPQRRP
jgi:two-component system, cell cycle sensor histidine kinase and response regulator CckA